MEWLNYHHLLYFWLVAREGSMSAAARRLNMSHSTISGQVAELEQALGQRLFLRTGRGGLQLTETGRQVVRYADQIFSLGREMLEVVREEAAGGPMRVAVGVVDTLSRLVAAQLVEPVLRMNEPTQLTCRRDSQQRLLSELSVGVVEFLLADAPLMPGGRVRAYNHLLGECGMSFLGTPELCAACRGPFPRSLHGAPFLLPAEGTALRRALGQFFDGAKVQPRVAGEFADDAVLEYLGQAGAGLFAAPTVVEGHLKKQYGLKVLGREPGAKLRYYAIALERRLKHPAALAIAETARNKLFG